jgi:hypothetical protein
MGSIVLYRCPRCQFQAQLISAGYQATYRPMVCGGCHQLVNVLEALSPKILRLAPPEMRELVGCCPVCRSKALTEWDDIDAPCPRCRTPMQSNDGASWDDTIKPTRTR